MSFSKSYILLFIAVLGCCFSSVLMSSDDGPVGADTTPLPGGRDRGCFPSAGYGLGGYGGFGGYGLGFNSNFDQLSKLSQSPILGPIDKLKARYLIAQIEQQNPNMSDQDRQAIHTIVKDIDRNKGIAEYGVYSFLGNETSMLLQGLDLSSQSPLNQACIGLTLKVVGALGVGMSKQIENSTGKGIDWIFNYVTSIISKYGDMRYYYRKHICRRSGEPFTIDYLRAQGIYVLMLLTKLNNQVQGGDRGKVKRFGDGIPGEDHIVDTRWNDERDAIVAELLFVAKDFQSRLEYYYEDADPDKYIRHGAEQVVFWIRHAVNIILDPSGVQQNQTQQQDQQQQDQQQQVSSSSSSSSSSPILLDDVIELDITKKRPPSSDLDLGSAKCQRGLIRAAEMISDHLLYVSNHIFGQKVDTHFIDLNVRAQMGGGMGMGGMGMLGGRH